MHPSSTHKNRQGAKITAAWITLNNKFKKEGAAPQTFILDNEISKDLLDSFDSERIKYQLVTTYKHRKNQAERAIQTFKSHFKEALATVDPNFPFPEWYYLIAQANITLNLLRSARCNPKLMSLVRSTS